MTQWLHGEINQLEGLIQAAVLLIGLAVVAATFAKTKAVVPTVGALVFAFVVVWAVHHVDWFDSKIGQEFNSLGAVPHRVTPTPPVLEIAARRAPAPLS